MPPPQAWSLEGGRLPCPQGHTKSSWAELEHQRISVWGEIQEFINQHYETALVTWAVSEQLWVFIRTDKQIATPLLLCSSSYPRWMWCTRTYHQKPPKLCTENGFKLFPFILSRTAILQMFAAVHSRVAQWVLCQAMSKILILLLGSGQSWDFGSGQMGTVTAFPPNPSLQKPNSLPRHEQLNVPWAVTRVRLLCSHTGFCTSFTHSKFSQVKGLSCVLKMC